MAKIVNISKVMTALKKQKKAKDINKISIVVGYSQHYAVHVHERTDLNHTNGEAKFLERPAREQADKISDTIIKTFRATGDMRTAVLMGGLLLQRLSQQLVPVDTGALKNSAFTRFE